LRPLLLFGLTVWECAAIAPAFVCRHRALLTYLAPSLALALVIRYLTRRHPLFFVLTLAGTVCHELAHFLVGLVTAAQPASFSVIPHRAGAGWELGSVTFNRVRWYNALPTALAPFLILALPVLVASWRAGPGWRFHWLDLALAFFIAPQFLMCWPSKADWQIALRSWPYPVIAALLWGAVVYGWPRLHASAHLIAA
jgi:hypothetical protein